MRKETDLLLMDGCSLQVSIRGGGGSRITEGTGVRYNILVIQQLGLVIKLLVGLPVILQRYLLVLG